MSIKIIFWNDQILNKYFYSQIVLSLYWYQILQQIGYLGLIIMIVIILKNYYQYNTIKDYITNNSSIFALGLLFLWSIISTILSESFNLSFFGSMYRKEGLLTYFTYIGVFYLGLSLKSKETVSRIMKIFVFTSLIISLLMIIDIEQVNSGLGFYPNSAVFYNINHFGYYLCMAIITAAGLALKSGKKKIYYFNLMFFSILVSALIKNKSFGPYLAVIAGLLFLAILIWQLHKSLFRRVITIILLFITISFVINISTGFFANEISRLGNSVTDIVKDNESAGKAGSGRWELWVGGIEFALEKPFFGYGPDNLESRYLEEDIEQDRPHNIFIQIAASLGIPALIFYLSVRLGKDMGTGTLSYHLT